MGAHLRSKLPYPDTGHRSDFDLTNWDHVRSAAAVLEYAANDELALHILEIMKQHDIDDLDTEAIASSPSAIHSYVRLSKLCDTQLSEQIVNWASLLDFSVSDGIVEDTLNGLFYMSATAKLLPNTHLSSSVEEILNRFTDEEAQLLCENSNLDPIAMIRMTKAYPDSELGMELARRGFDLDWLRSRNLDNLDLLLFAFLAPRFSFARIIRDSVMQDSQILEDDTFIEACLKALSHIVLKPSTRTAANLDQSTLLGQRPPIQPTGSLSPQ